jgi:hypothetical protein
MGQFASKNKNKNILEKESEIETKNYKINEKNDVKTNEKTIEKNKIDSNIESKKDTNIIEIKKDTNIIEIKKEDEVNIEGNKNNEKKIEDQKNNEIIKENNENINEENKNNINENKNIEIISIDDKKDKFERRKYLKERKRSKSIDFSKYSKNIKEIYDLKYIIKDGIFFIKKSKIN